MGATLDGEAVGYVPRIAHLGTLIITKSRVRPSWWKASRPKTLGVHTGLNAATQKDRSYRLSPFRHLWVVLVSEFAEIGVITRLCQPTQMGGKIFLQWWNIVIQQLRWH